MVPEAPRGNGARGETVARKGTSGLTASRAAQLKDELGTSVAASALGVSERRLDAWAAGRGSTSIREARQVGRTTKALDYMRGAVRDHRGSPPPRGPGGQYQRKPSDKEVGKALRTVIREGQRKHRTVGSNKRLSKAFGTVASVRRPETYQRRAGAR